MNDFFKAPLPFVTVEGERPVLSLHDRLLKILTLFMKFVSRLYSDSMQGIDITSPDRRYTNYSMPVIAKELAKKLVYNMKDSPLVRTYLTLLNRPDRVDCLLQALFNSYANHGEDYPDENYFEWIGMCCLICAALEYWGFKDASIIAIETTKAITMEYGRCNALRGIGYKMLW